MEAKIVANRDSRFGFTSDYSSTPYSLSSTFDSHRHAKSAEKTLVSFSREIPKAKVDYIMNWLVKIGAAVYDDRHQYATSSCTYQSDRLYIKNSLSAGKPIPRLVYRFTSSGRRIVDAWNGTHGMDPCLMGPLSIFGNLIGMSDSVWKEITRKRPLISYLENFNIPYTTEYGGVQVAGVNVNVSGHVINYILYTASLGTMFSRGFNLGGFRDEFVANFTSDTPSLEPTFSGTSWHSWLETEVAVLSGINMVFTMSGSGINLRHDAMKLAIMAGVDILRSCVRNARTSITTPRFGLRLYDKRFYTSIKDIKHVFVIMPMGTGKSTLAKNFDGQIIDIDDAVAGIQEKHKAMVEKASETGDWPNYNSWYYRRVSNFIEYMSNIAKRVYLIHNQELVKKLYPNSPFITLLLPREVCIDRVVKRDGQKAAKLAAGNYDGVEKYGSNKVYVADNDELCAVLFGWVYAGITMR